MRPVFEYSDTLNTPYEAFLFDAQKETFPVLPHWHYYMEIMMMLEGTAYIEADGQDYVLEPGDLILFHPQVSHAIYSTGQFPLRYHVIKCNPVYLNVSNSSLPAVSSLLTMAAENPDLSVFFSIKEIAHLSLETIFTEMIKIVTEKKFGYDIMAHSYCCMLITELLRLWEAQGFHLLPRSEHMSTNDKFTNIAEYIFQHYQENISIEDLAGQFHMSYSHFSSRFKEYYGQTCSQFIRKVRLQRAEDLLCFTDFDLSYISQETGFCDCSHFIHAFRSQYKITPKQFRDEFRRKHTPQSPPS